MEGNHENTNFFFLSFEGISEFTQKYLNEKYHIQKDSETAKKIYDLMNNFGKSSHFKSTYIEGKIDEYVKQLNKDIIQNDIDLLNDFIKNGVKSSVSKILNIPSDKIEVKKEYLDKLNNEYNKTDKDYAIEVISNKMISEHNEKKQALNNVKPQKIDFGDNLLDKEEIFENISKFFPNIIKENNQETIDLIHYLIQEAFDNRFNNNTIIKSQHFLNPKFINIIGKIDDKLLLKADDYNNIKKLLPQLPIELEKDLINLIITEITLENKNK